MIAEKQLDAEKSIRQPQLATAGVSVIVPAYNEEHGIGDVIDNLTQVMVENPIPYEIIIVDDGSGDRTAAIAASHDIRLISHETNMGYGRSLKSGIKAARYETIVITDADGTYPCSVIPQLLELMPGHDMIVGARTGKNVSIPTIRKPAKWAINKFANYLSGRKIPDLNSGLRVMRKESVLPFFRILPNGFSFTTTITLAMLTNDYRVHYVPIDYAKRQGKSKIRPFQDTLNFVQLILRTVLYFDPLKVFLPVSGVFMLISLLLLLYRTFVEAAFGVTSVLLFVTGIQLLATGMIADIINKRLR